MNQELTKENIETAIQFLETISEESFVKFEQTRDFDPKNIGKFHCVIGWLHVAPQSPFYQKNRVNFNGTTCLSANEDLLHRKLNEDWGLVHANNCAPDGKIKESVLNYLKNFEI